MAGRYPSSRFPYMYLRISGILLVIFGLAEFCVGTVDLLYTELRYGEGCSIPNNACMVGSPCNFSAIIYSRVAIGMWGAIFVITAGSIAASFRKDSQGAIKAKRNSVAILAGLVAFPIGPATIAVSVLRVMYSQNVFYCADANGELQVADYVEFLLPIMTAVALVLAWCVDLGIIFSLCKYGQLYRRNEERYARQTGYLSPTSNNTDIYDMSPRPERRPRRERRERREHIYGRHIPETERPQMHPSTRYWNPNDGYFGGRYYDNRSRFHNNNNGYERRYWPEEREQTRPRTRMSRWRQPWETLRRWTRSYHSMPNQGEYNRRRAYDDTNQYEEPRRYAHGSPYNAYGKDEGLDRNYFTMRARTYVRDY